MKTENDKGYFYWFGVRVKVKNFGRCTETGLLVCDLVPESKWPEKFHAAKKHVVYSLLRSEPLPKKKFYYSQNERTQDN